MRTSIISHKHTASPVIDQLGFYLQFLHISLVNSYLTTMISCVVKKMTQQRLGSRTYGGKPWFLEIGNRESLRDLHLHKLSVLIITPKYGRAGGILVAIAKVNSL